MINKVLPMTDLELATFKSGQYISFIESLQDGKSPLQVVVPKHAPCVEETVHTASKKTKTYKDIATSSGSNREQESVAEQEDDEKSIHYLPAGVFTSPSSPDKQSSYPPMNVEAMPFPPMNVEAMRFPPMNVEAMPLNTPYSNEYHSMCAHIPDDPSQVLVGTTPGVYVPPVSQVIPPVMLHSLPPHEFSFHANEVANFQPPKFMNLTIQVEVRTLANWMTMLTARDIQVVSVLKCDN